MDYRKNYEFWLNNPVLCAEAKAELAEKLCIIKEDTASEEQKS